MLRHASLAGIVASLVLAVPGAAQVGEPVILFTNRDGVSVIRVDGSGRTLLRGPCPRCQPVWSPDGSQFAFVENNIVKTMNADGSGERDLFNSLLGVKLGLQAWSPDGRSLAFQFAGGITVVTTAGEARRVINEPRIVFAPAWSPNGSRLAYTRGTDQGQDIFLVPAEGGSPTLIYFQRAVLGEPVWSPDGRQIALGIDDYTAGPGVYVVAADGTGGRRIAEGKVGAPVWTPDGAKIVFAKTVAYYDAFQYRDLHIVNADGTQEERLTHNYFSYYASLTSDGEQIVYVRGSYLGRMNTDGTCQAPVGERVLADVASWQPLPNGPSAGRRECHSLTVLATSRSAKRGAASVITVRVQNSGTRPLTDIQFVPRRSNDLTPTSVRTSKGRCSLRHDVVRCTIGALGPKRATEIVIHADGRRVSEAGIDGGALLRMPLEGRAREPSLNPASNRYEVVTFLSRCTTRTPGGGTIRDSRDPERICGRRGRDRIYSTGRDTVGAGNGDDVVFSRNRDADVVRCGPGRDRVVADRKDRVDADCERVSRR